MNTTDSNKWVDEVLTDVLVALARSSSLKEWLTFKGARILALRLPDTNRQSQDIDSVLMDVFTENYPEREAQKAALLQEIKKTLHSHFEGMSPVRFKLDHVEVRLQPRRLHPKGWNAFKVNLRIKDGLRPDVLGLPTIEIDVAAPETLNESSVGTLIVGGELINAYSLERIAGEKLRAFLSSLPAYQLKLGISSIKSPRAKDLCDLAMISRNKPIEGASEFWKTAANEFVTACSSRFVDCNGIDTFRENWETTRQAYNSNMALVRLASFAEAEDSLARIVEFMSNLGLFPMRHPFDAGTL